MKGERNFYSKRFFTYQLMEKNIDNGKKLFLQRKKYCKETSVVSIRLPIDMIEQIDLVCMLD